MTPDLVVTWDPGKAQANRARHGVTFAQAATVLRDPLAITVFDAAHSQDEERWFTLGLSRNGALLAVAHTYQVTGPPARRRGSFPHDRPRAVSASSIKTHPDR